MLLQIDVLTPAGAKVGSGPIVTATNWRSTPRLDRAGDFSFDVPAAEPRTSYLAYHNIVVARTLVNGTMTEIGRGIIDDVRFVDDANPSMLTVSGNDLLIQLAWRTVGTLIAATATTPLSVDPGITSLTPLDVHTLTVDIGSSGLPEGFDNAILFPGAGGKPYGYNFYTTSLSTHTAGNGVQPVGQWIDLTHIFDGDMTTQTLTIPTPSRSLWYVCYDSPFAALSFVLGTQKPTGHTLGLSVQYYNGSGWVSATVTSDTTKVGGASWRQNGVLTWTLPNDWVPYQQSVCPPNLDPSVDANFANLTGYWVRLFTNSPMAFQGDPGWTINDTVDIKEITISGLVPTQQAAAQIVGIANGLANATANGAGVISGTALPGSPPSQGWSFDVVNGQYQTSASNVFAQIQDDTVLAALTKLSELTNEHFRIGTGTQLVWLGTTTPSSGIRIVRVPPGTDPSSNPNIGQYTKLERQGSAAQLFTRIRPFGTGNNQARQTLAQTSRPSSGTFVAYDGTTHHFTLDAANNWLVDTDAETTYGRIEKVEDFNHIGPADDLSPTHVQLAADALYDVALVSLSQHSQVVVTYTVDVVGLSALVSPGQTVRLIRREMVDGFSIQAIDATLIVLEATSEISQQGIFTTSLKLSQYPRWPLSEAELFAKLEQTLKQVMRYGQPLDIGTISASPDVAGSGAFLLASGNGSISARQSQT